MKRLKVINLIISIASLVIFVIATIVSILFVISYLINDNFLYRVIILLYFVIINGITFLILFLMNIVGLLINVYKTDRYSDYKQKSIINKFILSRALIIMIPIISFIWQFIIIKLLG